MKTTLLNNNNSNNGNNGTFCILSAEARAIAKEVARENAKREKEAQKAREKEAKQVAKIEASIIKGYARTQRADALKCVRNRLINVPNVIRALKAEMATGKYDDYKVFLPASLDVQHCLSIKIDGGVIYLTAKPAKCGVLLFGKTWQFTIAKNTVNGCIGTLTGYQKMLVACAADSPEYLQTHTLLREVLQSNADDIAYNIGF